MKESVSRIPTLHTFENPIRSVVWANHCIWVEQVNKRLEDDFECAMYYEPYSNLVYPDTVDAIFVEISVNQKKYHVSGFAVVPDEEREEIKINEGYTDYNTAKQVAVHWLLEARKFINSQYKHTKLSYLCNEHVTPR
ncbi:MAG: hypothetical protein H6Q71_1420 [Firmicutes bacterium]|nr:hypothetical protein [Bacillota bacterium]